MRWLSFLTALLKVRQQPADLPVRALCLLCEAVSPAAFFSNESGLGSAPIVAAAAKNEMAG